MDARLLVVEPDPSVPGRWRFGRVASPEDELAGSVGVLELRAGAFHLVAVAADSIMALQLVRNWDGPPRRLVHEPPSPVPSWPPTGAPQRTVSVRAAATPRAPRASGVGGPGRSPADRDERGRRQR